MSEETSRAIGELPAKHPPVKIQKMGVLLVNLGTPDGTDYRSMRRYLQASSCPTSASSSGRARSGIRFFTASS
jgi:hypothetical protein